MELQAHMNKMKEIYEQILNYVEKDEDIDSYTSIVQYFENQKLENHNELKEILYMLLKFSKNHHRQTNFFDKIEKIFVLLKDKINNSFPNSEIFEIFKKNKRFLLFLIDNKLITIDETISGYLINKYCRYFYPELKSQLDEENRQKIESELFENSTNLTDFEENRRKGENNSPLCHLIRNDLVEDFVVLANKTNLNLTSKISSSVFETNCFLIDKEPTIIEYAAFYGSIQIFNFLKLNNVPLNPSLWLYAIHSNNPEMIHLLEESQIQPDDKTYEKCLEESIKCHHNDIANYIQNNSLNESKNSFEQNDAAYGFHYHNYKFIDTENKFAFHYACKYDYFTIVENMINIEGFDINSKVSIITKNDVLNFDFFFFNIVSILYNL